MDDPHPASESPSALQPGAAPSIPITEAQAEARRANGRLSKGPTSTQGKAISSQNARKHGCYQRVFGLIDRGPLREDGDELEELREEVYASLPSTATPLLAALASGVVDALWRCRRARRWESHALSHLTGPDRAISPYGKRLPELAQELADKAAYEVLTSDLGRNLLRLDQHQSNQLRKALDEYYTQLARHQATGCRVDDEDEPDG